MLRGGANPCSISLRQVHDKATVGGLERKQISSPQPSGADRWADFGDRPDFPPLTENVVRHGVGRADAMEYEIIVDDFAGQPGAAESGAEAGRQCRGATRKSVRAAGKRPCDGPGGAGGRSAIRRRHGDFGDDGLAGEE